MNFAKFYRKYLLQNNPASMIFSKLSLDIDLPAIPKNIKNENVFLYLLLRTEIAYPDFRLL